MIGQIVDGFAFERALGAGGMGEVYLARSSSGEQRAYKVVRADHDAATQAAARFKREALALGRLAHPNVVRIVDAGRFASGELYLAMEYVAGSDLQTAVKNAGPFAAGDAIAILVQLAAALAYAHAQGIVHRDLKPGNVILEADDPRRAKIIDFGLAKIALDEKLTRLTEDEQVLGSPLYWAPEQGTTAQVGPAADIYALGGIAYFLLSGAPIFTPRPAIALVYAHQHARPEPLSARAGVELPAGMDELIAACVAKQPAQRPSAEELVLALDRLAAEAPATVARGSRPPRLFTSTGTSDLEDAVAAQIRQVVLDLAQLLEQPTDDIDALQNQLSDLELELAMLDSEVDATLDARDARHVQVERTVDGLRTQLTAAYRQLTDRLITLKANSPGDAAALYAELDALFARYRAS